MKAFIKVLSFLLGVTLLGIVVWLGFLTANNQSPQLVALFGVASAVVAPIGLALIGYVFTANDQVVINRLAKIPEIEKLIEEANSQEEKIKLLEKQQQQLAEIVQLEARRQSLIHRKETNEREAVRLLKELEAIDTELSSLDITVNENKEIAEELNALHERIIARQRGDIVLSFGNFKFILEADIIRRLPLGWLIYEYLMFSNRLTDWINSKVKQFLENRDKNRNI